MPVDCRRALGADGESRVVLFLRSLGYEIVEQNARTRWGELDIVAKDGGELVFVEVKSRRTGGTSAPIESLTPQKVRRLVRLAQAYVSAQPEPDPPWRIDVVTLLVRADGSIEELTHIPSAVEGSW
jgi:putative endonuclease